jgi:hypothetical protein
MKKLFLLASLFMAAAVGAQTPTPAPSRPIIVRPSYESSSVEEDKRFQFCENIGGSGFFWIDTVTGDLWRTSPPDLEWIFLGNPRGANSGHHGTYQLLSDRKDGVYVLNTDNGEGWWTDGTSWKIIGELSRRAKKSE